LSRPQIVTMSNYIEELRWRGMIHDVMPGAEAHLLESMRSGYVGFDPTADSLHIGNLVTIMMLAHFQRCGHRPLALVGGATGMIGDPSGKSAERNFLDETTLRHNQQAIQIQLEKFLRFSSSTDASGDRSNDNSALMVNNYDWMKSFSFLDFIRDVGKHITVNYMMAKDSVKNRITVDSSEDVSAGGSEGMSFTEFTYQLVQGYDFLHLFQNQNCSLQMGGSDQWGNITTGTELIRRIGGGKAFAITCPLITKADGSKFGKSEGGNVWLDSARTSAYKFYQYWLNSSDEDSERYIRIFTFLDEAQINALVIEHSEAKHLRVLQKRLADEITTMVHSADALEKAKQASNILFGNATADDLKSLDEQTFLEVFEGVTQAEIPASMFQDGLDIVAALATETSFLKSNNEARRALKENSVAVNKVKVAEGHKIGTSDLINGTFVLLQRGKKNYYVLKAV